MMTQTCQIEAARDQAPWLMLIPLCLNYLPVGWCKLNSKQNLYPRLQSWEGRGAMVDLWPQRWWLSVQFA